MSMLSKLSFIISESKLSFIYAPRAQWGLKPLRPHLGVVHIPLTIIHLQILLGQSLMTFIFASSHAAPRLREYVSQNGEVFRFMDA